MSDYSWEVQQAVYSALVGVSPTIAGGRIYNDVPEKGLVWPFVEIADGDYVPDDVSVSDGGIAEFIDLHVYSDYRGDKEVKEIMGEIYSALHETTLSVTGRSSAHCWVRRSRRFRDNDGLRRHGVISIEVIHRS